MNKANFSWKDPDVLKESKKRLINALIIPVMIYEAETCLINKSDQKIIEACTNGMPKKNTQNLLD